MKTYLLQETRLLRIEPQDIRIEIFKDVDSSRFRVAAYQARPLKEFPPSDPPLQIWAALPYNFDETEDVDATIREIVEKVKRKAGSDPVKR